METRRHGVNFYPFARPCTLIWRARIDAITVSVSIRSSGDRRRTPRVGLFSEDMSATLCTDQEALNTRPIALPCSHRLLVQPFYLEGWR